MGGEGGSPRRGGHHSGRRRHLDGVDEVQQDLALVAALHELHVLHDEVRGGADAPHRQEDVPVQEVAGQPLDLLRAPPTQPFGREPL